MAAVMGLMCYACSDSYEEFQNESLHHRVPVMKMMMMFCLPVTPVQSRNPADSFFDSQR